MTISDSKHVSVYMHAYLYLYINFSFMYVFAVVVCVWYCVCLLVCYVFLCASTELPGIFGLKINFIIIIASKSKNLLKPHTDLYVSIYG